MHTTDMHDEHSLLSDSSYELINNTDTESQDGFGPSLSVCSSDYYRSDDINSLADTEHTNDEQDRHSDNSEEEEGAFAPRRVHHESDEGSDSDRPDETESAAGSDEEDAEQDSTSVFEPLRASEPATETETPVVSRVIEDRVRASAIEYAEESLKLPSSANSSSDADSHNKAYVPESLVAYWKYAQEVLRRPVWATLIYWSGMIALGSVMVYVGLRLGPSPPAQEVQISTETTVFVPVKNPVTISTSTVIINHTSTKTVLVEPRATPATPLLPASHPVEKIDPKGICSAELQGQREILVKIPEGTKLSWLAKDAISIDVSRGQDSVKARFSSVDDGILIEIPKKEAHGVLSVSVTTTRRPKVNETFAIDLGKGALGQALDFGRLLLESSANKLSSSAHEAAQFVKAQVDPRPSSIWEDTFKNTFKSFHGLAGQVGEQLESAWREARNLPSGRPKWMSKLQRRQQDLQDDAEIALLRAQISANLIWLKIQGRTEEHDAYLEKASSYVQAKIAAAQKAKEERLAGPRKNGCMGAGRCNGFSRWVHQ